MGSTYWLFRVIRSSKFWLVLIAFLLASNVYAFRISRPTTFILPWTEEQMAQLNDTLEDIWLLQLGEFNLDIVATTRSKANNGDFWLIQTGTTV